MKRLLITVSLLFLLLGYYEWPTHQVVMPDRGKLLRNSAEYIHQLSRYLYDCESIQQNLSTTPYTVEGMLSTFSTYAKCKESATRVNRVKLYSM